MQYFQWPIFNCFLGGQSKKYLFLLLNLVNYPHSVMPVTVVVMSVTSHFKDRGEFIYSHDNENNIFNKQNHLANHIWGIS